MLQSIKEFKALSSPYYWLTAMLIAKNSLARQYRNSFLGMLWTLILPLTQVAIYAAIMPKIMKFPADNYILFLIGALPLWTFIMNTLHSCSGSIINQAETLKRCVVTSTVFPVADVMRAAYTYLLSFAIMYCFCIIAVGGFDPMIFLYPLYFLPVFAIVLIGSVTVAYIAPYMRDIGELILVSTNILFWMTPIVYPITALPPFYQALMEWNPFYIMIHPVQQLVHTHELPSLLDTFKLYGLVVVVAVICYPLFKLCRKNYVYYL